MNINLPLACLGGEKLVQTNYQIACYGAIIAGAIGAISLLVEVRRHRMIWWSLYGAFVLVHPGWRMWPSFHRDDLIVASDCGASTAFLATADVVILLALLLLLLFRPNFSRSMFLIVLASVCWSSYLVTWLYWQRPFELLLPPNQVLADIFASEPMEAFMISSGRLFDYSITFSVLALVTYLLKRRSAQSNQSLEPTPDRL